MESEKRKAKLSIDANCYYQDTNIIPLSLFEIDFFSLKEGDSVIGFQDDQEWEGIVKYDSSYPDGMRWFVELDYNREYAVSAERVEGREEGFLSGIPVGEFRGEVKVIEAMLLDGMDIDRIKRYTCLSETVIRNVKIGIENRNSLFWGPNLAPQDPQNPKNTL